MSWKVRARKRRLRSWYWDVVPAGGDSIHVFAYEAGQETLLKVIPYDEAGALAADRLIADLRAGRVYEKTLLQELRT